MQRPRVLLIDDTPEIVEYCSELLNEDYDVVGTASDGWAAIDLCAALDPDVIVLDICLPRLDGIAVLTVLRSFGCRANIVFLSSDGSLAEDAIGAGGEAFVWKISLSRDLRIAIREALAGRIFVSSADENRGEREQYQFQ
ncbi:MAG: response regulator transcription factor [Terriglobales bacterium]|jgi:DNA-binding NarL/FixJ family response regulator